MIKWGIAGKTKEKIKAVILDKMLDEHTKSQIVNILGIVIGLIALGIAVYEQFKDPQTGMLFFLGILAFVALYFIVSYPIAILRQRFNQINNNSLLISEIKKDLNNLKGMINIIIDTARLTSKVDFLEREVIKMKNKRGQIDPRWIILLIIIILLLLYLKSKGYLG